MGVIYKCQDCDEVIAEDDYEKDPLYECGECGTMFTRSQSANDNHQCPNDYKFGSKVSDTGCPQCGQGEMEKIEDGIQCPHCHEWFSGGDAEG